jgi:hypothetical protein
MQNPHPSPDLLSELVDCLEQKGKFLEAFLDLTKSLRDRLITQEWSGVEGLLKQRQDLTFAVDQMNVRIQVLRSRQPLDPKRLPDVQRKKVSSLLDTLRAISEEARAVDKECMDRMTEWRGQIKSQLSRMRGSLKAVHGYVQKPTRPPKFLDVRR